MPEVAGSVVSGLTHCGHFDTLVEVGLSVERVKVSEVEHVDDVTCGFVDCDILGRLVKCELFHEKY